MEEKKYRMQIDLDTFRNLEGCEQLADKIILGRFLMTMPNDLRIPYDVPLYINVKKIPYSNFRFAEEMDKHLVHDNYVLNKQYEHCMRDLCPFDIEIEIKELEIYKPPIVEIPKVVVENAKKPTLWQRFKKWLKRK